MNPLNETIDFEQMKKRLWGDIRQHRNDLLAKTDVEINKRLDRGEDVSAWRTYREQLRDLPQSVSEPTQVVWPTKPQ